MKQFVHKKNDFRFVEDGNSECQFLFHAARSCARPAFAKRFYLSIDIFYQIVILFKGGQNTE